MSDRKSNLRHTKCVILAAILAALSFVFLFIGAATSVLDLTAIVVAGACSAITLIELGGIYPYLVWAVTGVLSAVLLPDKFVAVEYILFGGIYPIIKQYFQRLPRLFSWIAKLAYFNAVLTAAIAIAKFVMNLPDDYGMTYSIPAYLVGNAFFFITELFLSAVITLYAVKLRGRLKIDKILRG